MEAAGCSFSCLPCCRGPTKQMPQLMPAAATAAPTTEAAACRGSPLRAHPSDSQRLPVSWGGHARPACCACWAASAGLQPLDCIDPPFARVLATCIVSQDTLVPILQAGVQVLHRPAAGCRCTGCVPLPGVPLAAAVPVSAQQLPLRLAAQPQPAVAARRTARHAQCLLAGPEVLTWLNCRAWSRPWRWSALCACDAPHSLSHT